MIVNTLLLMVILPFTYAAKDYDLRCDIQEVGILWPNYLDNTAYYMCPRVGEKQITMRCDSQKVFCYVLQSCVNANEYIPPPPLDHLPTARPSISTAITPTGPTQTTTTLGPLITIPSFPTPKHPTGILAPSSALPTGSTPSGFPTPPNQSTFPTPPTQSTFPTPPISGSTIPPGPPSPPASGIPMPPTPPATPPVINVTPEGPINGP